MAGRVENLRPRGEVECTPLAEAIEASGMTMCEIAKRLGWFRTVPDTQRLRRRLGLTKHNGRYTRHMDYEIAVAICEVANIDPVDVGC